MLKALSLQASALFFDMKESAVAGLAAGSFGARDGFV
jgi:hypothetical protein